MKWLMPIPLIVIALLLYVSCGEETVNPPDGTGDDGIPPISDTTTVKGFGILHQLPGIWNGPVTSSTPLGSYPEWIVDFRPISKAQVSAKNELDHVNDIFMSFFIVLHDSTYKVAFRNGGGFAGLQRNAYQVIDTVKESSNENYYRFKDAAAGTKRVFTEVIFRQDSLIIQTYTSKYGTVQPPVLHMRWSAKLQDTTSARASVQQFDFPQKVLVRDFSTTFNGLTEAIFYNEMQDPYPADSQPYLSNLNATVTISNPVSPDSARNILIIITTEPLFNGFIFLPDQLKFRSRYVFLPAASSTNYTFDYFHPGDYYMNAVYDANGDGNFSLGDYINQPFDQAFTVDAASTANKTIDISFQIP